MGSLSPGLRHGLSFTTAPLTIGISSRHVGGIQGIICPLTISSAMATALGIRAKKPWETLANQWEGGLLRAQESLTKKSSEQVSSIASQKQHPGHYSRDPSKGRPP